MLLPEVSEKEVWLLDVEVSDDIFEPLLGRRVDGKRKARKNPVDEVPEFSTYDTPLERLQKIGERRKAERIEEELRSENRLLGKEESLDFWETYIFPLLDPPLDLDFPSIVLPVNQRLFGFQLDGIKHLVANPNFLLADTMGLGKTIQVIVACRILFQQGMIKSVLVICPRGIVYQWEDEFEKWAPALEALVVYGSAGERAACWSRQKHVYITSYDSLKIDCGDEKRPQGSPVFDLVVVDECQRIKNPNSDRARCVVGVPLPRSRRWGLSGTPVENRKEDIVSIFKFIKRAPNGGNVGRVAEASDRTPYAAETCGRC